MARLEDQVKTLQEQLRQARETIELQADRITELTRELQGRVEDSQAYKAQMDALYLARLQASRGSKDDLAARVQKLETDLYEQAGRHQLELYQRDEKIKSMQRVIDWQEIMIDALKGSEADGQQAETRTIPNARKPGARRKYSEEIRQQIRERYQNGQSMAQIARDTGVSKTQIHAIIHEAGQ